MERRSTSFLREHKTGNVRSAVLGMPTENGMYVLDTDASVVAISGILHQEENGMVERFSVPLHTAAKS